MKQDFNPVKETVHFGNDSIVIKKYIAGIEGGKTLDTTGFADSVINAGHVIITDGNGEYKPMPVKSGAYDALPSGWNYAGILYRTILTNKPSASIMTWGIVNEAVAPYPVAAIKEAFVAAVPHVEFKKDEEA